MSTVSRVPPADPLTTFTTWCGWVYWCGVPVSALVFFCVTIFVHPLLALFGWPFAALLWPIPAVILLAMWLGA